MDGSQTIRVNFGRPVPIFPLDSAVLLPQQVMPLHIFEPRYREMVADALDSSGQIAMAVFEGEAWKDEYHGNPPIRRAVCLGQIAQHERLPDGRYNILLQGVCRARVVDEQMPTEERAYRTATLEPLGTDGPVEPEVSVEIDRLRQWVESSLAEGPLAQLTVAENVLEYVRNEDVPTPTLIELLSFTLVIEPDARYRLLAEPEVARRARMVQSELEGLYTLIRLAKSQHPEQWPKGLSWN